MNLIELIDGQLAPVDIPAHVANLHRQLAEVTRQRDAALSELAEMTRIKENLVSQNVELMEDNRAIRKERDALKATRRTIQRRYCPVCGDPIEDVYYDGQRVAVGSSCSCALIQVERTP